MEQLVNKLRLSPTGRLMCLSVLGLYAGLLALGLLVGICVYPFEQPAPYALGLTLGCALSAGKVVLLEKSIDYSLDLSKGWAQGFSVVQTVLRYLLTAGVLICAFTFPLVIGVVGTVLGMLTLQIAAHIAGFLMSRKD